MKKLATLFLALATFSCNNPSNEERTDKNSQTTGRVEKSKAENKDILDTTTTYKTPDSISKPTDHTTINNSTDNFIGFNSFYKQFDKPVQTFTLNVNEDKTITCEEGTKITVKSNSFVTKSGKPVKDHIKLQIREYYKTSDMLLANLTTTSNNDILETGGMLHIEASSNGEKCVLIEDRTIEIAFPVKDKKDDMHLFCGKRNKGENIKWLVENTTDLSHVYATDEISEMPSYPGGERRMREYLSRQIEYPQSTAEKGIQGVVYVGFVVTRDGTLKDIEVLRGVHPSLDSTALSAVMQMPDWKPGKQKGEFVNVRFTLPLSFRLEDEEFDTGNIQFVQDFESKTNDENLQESKISELSQYIFSTSKLGWINCDRFYKDNNPKIDYFVDIGSNKKVDIKLVFNDINSILTGWLNQGKYTFNSVPTGHEVTLVALKHENDQYYLAVTTTTISKNEKPTLDFEPVTMAKLKTEMEKLNRI